MGLETGTYISDLNASNPIHATDPVSQGDDHIRLIKSVLLATFPNVDGAVNFTPTEANLLDGLTGVTGSGDLVASASPTLTGTLTAAAANFSGALTALSYGGITEANLVDKSANETISGDWDFAAITATSYGGITEANLLDKSAAETVSGVYDFSNGLTTPSISDGSGAIDFGSTNISTDNDDAQEPGWKGIPQNTQNGNYTLVLGDAGKRIYKASGGSGETITIPANASVAFPIGTAIEIVNRGGGTLSIAVTSDSLILYGAGSTGTRTLANNGKAIIEKVASTVWMIGGIGLS